MGMFALLILNCGCSPERLSRTFFAADTVCTITLFNSSGDTLDSAVNTCNELFTMFDRYNTDSALFELNKNSYLKNAPNELTDIIKTALEYSRQSNGLFDPTICAVSSLWNFKGTSLPDPKKIRSAIKSVDYKNCVLNNDNITLNNNAKIDLGAIAKGYVADKVADQLLNDGVNEAILNLGGNVTVIGNNNGQKYSIGIKKPFAEDNITTVKVKNKSVVTSGIYQRYISYNGEYYHHLLDPDTGMPMQNDLNSVTIIANSATEADALSTICFLLGKTKGLNFINSLENTEAVFIDRSNSLYFSNGLTQTGICE